jgi:hypothetical protein
MLQCPLKRQPTKPNVKGDAGLDCGLGVEQGGVREDDGAASAAVVEGGSFSQIQSAINIWPSTMGQFSRETVVVSGDIGGVHRRR